MASLKHLIIMSNLSCYLVGVSARKYQHVRNCAEVGALFITVPI